MLPKRSECVLRNVRLRYKSKWFKSYDLRQYLQENRNSYYVHGSEVWNRLSAAELEDKINNTQRRIVKNIWGFTLKRDLTFITGSCIL